MFYPDRFESNYEKLIKYYPRFYREVREMDAILRMHGKLADDLEDSVERVVNDSFVDFADESTIAQLEEILDIPYSNIVGKTLDERRSQVKAFFIGNGHLSASMIIEMIKVYTDAEVEIEFTDYTSSGFSAGNFLDGSRNLDGTQGLDGKSSVTGGTDQALYITIVREGTQNINVNDILLLLERIIPAHLVYFITDAMDTILDCSDLEHVYLRTIEIAMHIPETELIGYGCMPGLGYNLDPVSEEEKITLASVIHAGAAQNTEEEADVSSIGITAQAVPEDEDYSMNVNLAINTGFTTSPETISGEVEIYHNLRYLDGSDLLDGNTLLDSTYEKEDL